MGIVYVPPPDYGLDRLFSLGMAKLKNKQALEELMKRHELEMDQKNAEWGREDSVKQADRQYENSVLQGALGSSGGGSPGMGASIPGRGPSPGGPSPAGGIPGLMNRSPISAPPSLLDALRGAGAAGGNIAATDAVMKMLSSATGIDLRNKAGIAAMQRGLADGVGMGAYSPLINPDGFTFRPADQTELKNNLNVANIRADADRYGAELGLKGQQAAAGASIFSYKVREKLGLKDNDLGWAIHNEKTRQFDEEKPDRASVRELNKSLVLQRFHDMKTGAPAPVLGVDVRPDKDGYYNLSDVWDSQQGQAIRAGFDSQAANNLISNNPASDNSETSSKTIVGQFLREMNAFGYKIRIDANPKELASPVADMFGDITPEEIAARAKGRNGGK